MESMQKLSFWRTVLFRWRGALCWERGAAMAFFALFSIAPLFVLLLSLLDRLFGVGVVRGEIYTVLVRTLGAGTAEAIRALLLQPGLFQGDLTTTVANAVLTAIGSAALFRHMQHSLTIIWHRHEERGEASSYFLGSFFRSFFALGALTVFVVGGLFLLASGLLFGPILKRLVFGEGIPPVWPVLFSAFALLGSTGVFAVLYATLSRERPSLRRLGISSTVVFVSLFFAKAVVGSFAQTKALFSLFGAGSAVVYLLLWCFLLAQVFLLAAVIAGVRTER